MLPGVTVVTPTTPPRAASFLPRAIASVQAQEFGPAAHLIAVDHQRQGEAATRNQGLFAVETEWTAFLDDDDELYPNHLRALLSHQEATGADLVYPWFDVEGGTDPLGWEGQEPDLSALREANYIPVTHLVRTELAKTVGGFPEPLSEEWPLDRCVDWGFLLRLVGAGARFAHLPARTWRWHHHEGNYSGRVWS